MAHIETETRQARIAAAMEQGRQARSDALRNGIKALRDLLLHWCDDARAALRV